MPDTLRPEFDITPYQRTTPTSTVSSSTFSSLPTTATTTSAPKHQHGVGSSDCSDSIPSIPLPIGRSASISSFGSSCGTNISINRRFCITPPPALIFDGLRSATSSACHTPVIAPEPFAVAPDFQGLTLDMGVKDIVEDIVDHGFELIEDEKTDQEVVRYPHRRNLSAWTVSGESDSVNMTINQSPIMNRSRPSRHDLPHHDLDDDPDVLFGYDTEHELDDEYSQAADEIVIVEQAETPVIREPFDEEEMNALALSLRQNQEPLPIFSSMDDRHALVTSDFDFDSYSEYYDDEPHSGTERSLVENVYLDPEVYIDHDEPTPRSTASEELRRERRSNSTKTFCFDAYQKWDEPLMTHYLKLVHEEQRSTLDDAEIEFIAGAGQSASDEESESEEFTFRLDPNLLQHS